MNNETLIGDKGTKFTLPSYKGLLNERVVNKTDTISKIVLFKGNPYTWDSTSRKGKGQNIQIIETND